MYFIMYNYTKPKASNSGWSKCMSYTSICVSPKGFSKTLMFFEGCRSHLGCSVLLRGGDYHQLKKVTFGLLTFQTHLLPML